MTLNDYLKSRKQSAYAFAKQIGVSRQLVGLWLSGSSIPRRGNLTKIEEATNGRVKVKDFYENAA